MSSSKTSKPRTLERALVFLEQPKASPEEVSMSIVIGRLIEFTKLYDIEKLIVAAVEPQYFLSLPDLFELAHRYYPKLGPKHWITTKYKGILFDAYSDFQVYHANNELLWDAEVESEDSIREMLQTK